MESTPRVYPKNIAPVSPMKIRAGLKLNGRKPIHAPTSMAIMHMTFISVSVRSSVRRSVAAEMVETPQDKPSSPSIRFTAFVMAVIQITVTTGANTPSSTVYPKRLNCSMEIPPNTAMIDAAICIKSLTNAFISYLSSIIPVITITRFPISIVTVGIVGLQKIRTETVNATKIATPPISGISFLCMRRLSLGISVTLNLKASVRTTGVDVTEMKNAHTNAITMPYIALYTDPYISNMK